MEADRSAPAALDRADRHRAVLRLLHERHHLAGLAGDVVLEAAEARAAADPATDDGALRERLLDAGDLRGAGRNADRVRAGGRIAEPDERAVRRAAREGNGL